MFCIPLIAAAAGVLFFSQRNCCELCVGGIDLNDQCWLDNPICYSRKSLCYEQCMANKGHNCWRTKPDLTAVNFLNNDFINCEYKDGPARVCEVKICCDKAYVILSFADCKKMAFELYKPVEKGDCGIWAVKRYAYI